MTEIPLSDGSIAIVDDEDAHLSRFRWHHVGQYALRHEETPSGRRSIYMHREILQPGTSLVDHVNGDGLDNRRTNLRACSRAENNRHRRSAEGSSSRFVGVVWNRRLRKWTAQIRGRHLGVFKVEEEAARAYDAAARRAYGDFASVNLNETGGGA